MARLFALIRTIAFGVLLMSVAPATSPVSAQVNPNASAMTMERMWTRHVVIIVILP